MPGQPDYTVALVGPDGEPDMTVAVIGQDVIDLTGATDGQVLTIQPDGSVAADDAGTPGPHAATHEDGGVDEVTLAQSHDPHNDFAAATDLFLASYADLNNYGDYDVGEVVRFDSVLSLANINNVASYLATKFGLPWTPAT